MKEQRNRLVDKKVYVKWYNLAKEIIKEENLIPESKTLAKRFVEEINKNGV